MLCYSSFQQHNMYRLVWERLAMFSPTTWKCFSLVKSQKNMSSDFTKISVDYCRVRLFSFCIFKVRIFFLFGDRKNHNKVKKIYPPLKFKWSFPKGSQNNVVFFFQTWLNMVVVRYYKELSSTGRVYHAAETKIRKIVGENVMKLQTEQCFYVDIDDGNV